MQTIKTAVVVVLLLAVCYGAIVALNAPDPKLPPELEQLANSSSDLDLSMDPSELVPLDPSRSPRSGKPRAEYDSTSNYPVRESDQLDSATNLTSPTLPKFDLSGHPSSIPAVRMPETLGPDGPAVQMPNAAGLPGSMMSGAQSTAPRGTDSGPSDSVPHGRLPISGMLAASTSSNSWSNSNATELPRDLRDARAGDLASLPSIPTVTSPAVNTTATPSGQRDATSANQASTGAAALPTQPFKVAREQALKMAAEGRLKDALASLSAYYHSVELTRDEFNDLVDLLDALSREVIYSKQPLMEPAYRSEAGDTLQSIALKHNLSTELLARINALGASNVILPGTQLKVLRGPFRAEVDLTRGELTLFVGDLYAGRFPISTGDDPTPREGNFEIVDKRRDRTYYGTGGNIISADDPHNPYGGYWINLGQDMCIHGTAEMITTDLAKAGCISLAPIDASDVYGILVQGSRIRVHR